MDSTLLGAFIGAIATIVAAKIGSRALRKPSVAAVVITVLPDRIAVFRKARELVESATESVLDTTWGNSEENFLPAEKAALEVYLNAKKEATKNPKISYREIYTEAPDDDHRRERIDRVRNESTPLDRYSAKLLHGLAPSFPMMDFVVVDGNKLLLTCLSKDISKTDHHHLFIESTQLASFMSQYFQICWDKAELLSAKESVGLNNASVAAYPALEATCEQSRAGDSTTR